MPSVTYYVRGNRIYDITKDPLYNTGVPVAEQQSFADQSSWTFSNNAALVLLNFLTSDQYGPGWTLDDVDIPAFIEAATIAADTSNTDQQNKTVSGKVYETTTRDILRYEFNGSLSTSDSYQNSIEEIISVMPGAVFFRTVAGKWKLEVPSGSKTIDTQQGPRTDYEITVDDLTSPVEVNYPDADERLNALTTTFANSSKDFAEDSLLRPEMDSTLYSRYLSEDSNRPLRGTVRSSGISNVYSAGNIGLTNLILSRLPSFTFRMRPRGFLYEPGDIVVVSDPLINLSETIRIQEVNVMSNLDVEITGQRYNNANFQWFDQANEVVNTRTEINFNLVAPSIVPTWETNTRSVRLNITPDDDEDSSTYNYEIQRRKAGEDDFTAVRLVPAGTALAYDEVTETGTYEYRTVAVGVSLRRSQPSASASATVTRRDLAADVVVDLSDTLLVLTNDITSASFELGVSLPDTSLGYVETIEENVVAVWTYTATASVPDAFTLTDSTTQNTATFTVTDVTQPARVDLAITVVDQFGTQTTLNRSVAVSLVSTSTTAVQANPPAGNDPGEEGNFIFATSNDTLWIYTNGEWMMLDLSILTQNLVNGEVKLLDEVYAYLYRYLFTAYSTNADGTGFVPGLEDVDASFTSLYVGKRNSQEPRTSKPVSYTHLTLPTICSV